MPDLKTQHSVSDSERSEADSDIHAGQNDHDADTLNGNGHHANGHHQNGNGAAGQVKLTQAETPDPIVEPEFLEVPDRQNGHASQPAIEYQQPSSGAVPSPEESTVQEPDIRPRSIRMQLRFWRTLIFAAWLFARVLFWQVYVNRYFPGYVKRNEIKRWKKYAREYRGFAVQLGGVFIKLGQFISTRVDIFPEDIIKELESLQDEVPTIKFEKIRKALELELGPIDARYSEFNRDPIAAASLGQVHKARLNNGDKVVVKVQRPGIRDVCFTDLAAMRVVARVAMRFQFINNRADASALVEEFGKVLLEELSYRHEAYNAHRFAEMFKNDMGVYIPSVYNEHSTDHVLTIEDVTSIKINDYEAMERAGISRKAVANRLMDTYLPQVFNHFFFHADPHPGNLFVYPLPVDDETQDFGPEGRPFYLIFVDFGMTGSLTREIADGMVSTLSAVLTRDTKRLVDSYAKLGFLLPNADIDRIVEATEAAFDQVWGLSMTEMRDIDYNKVTHLAEEFNDLIFSMPFYIPQDFIYLGRTISILSGMCTSLDPQYNPWHELQPYTETLIARGFGINIPQGQMLQGCLTTNLVQSLFSGNGSEVLRQITKEASRRALGPLSDVEATIKRLNEGQIQITSKMDLLSKQQMKRLERETRRASRATFFGSVLISSTLLYVNGFTDIALAGYALCSIVLIFGPLRD